MGPKGHITQQHTHLGRGGGVRGGAGKMGKEENKDNDKNDEDERRGARSSLSFPWRRKRRSHTVLS